MRMRYNNEQQQIKRSTCKLLYKVLCCCVLEYIGKYKRRRRRSKNRKKTKYKYTESACDVMRCVVLRCGYTNRIVFPRITEILNHTYFISAYFFFSRHLLLFDDFFFLFLSPIFHFQLIFTLHLHFINLWSSIFIRTIRLTFPIRLLCVCVCVTVCCCCCCCWRWFVSHRT